MCRRRGFDTGFEIWCDDCRAVVENHIEYEFFGEPGYGGYLSTNTCGQCGSEDLYDGEELLELYVEERDALTLLLEQSMSVCTDAHVRLANEHLRQMREGLERLGVRESTIETF